MLDSKLYKQRENNTTKRYSFIETLYIMYIMQILVDCCICGSFMLFFILSLKRRLAKDTVTLKRINKI